MAVNLWSADGKPTSYNPLANTTLNLDLFKNYVITFKAKSLSSSKLTVSSWDSVNELHQVFNLTTEMKNYKFEWYESQGGHLYIKDTDTKGDIIIEDIQLVEKPMGVATINGVDDGITDWIQYDDVTLKKSISDVPVVPNTNYSISVNTGFLIGINEINNSSGIINWKNYANSISFTTTSNTYSIRPFIQKVGGTSLSLSDILSAKPMLNLGSTPAPYEKKRGERMVEPVFNTDGSVQINKKPNKRQQLYSWMDNFEGKVSGSEVENPHVAKYVYSTILNAPTGAWFGEENYSPIKTLDSSPAIRTRLVNGEYAQQLFSFNLIELVKRKLGYDVPGTTTADKVQWLKDNVSKLTCSWYGFGNSVGGNKASLSVWNAVTISYTDTITHTSSSVTRLGLGIATPPTIANRIDVNGFIHFLAYAEPSDGVTASTINTDYVEVLVDTKPIVNLLDSGVLNAVNKVPKKNLFDGSAPKTSGFGTTEFINEILTVNGTWYTSFGIDVKPNTDYFLSGSAIGTITSTINIWSVDGGSGIIKNEALNTTFNTGAYNKIFIAFYSGNATSGVSTFNNIQLEEGPISTRYEHYTLVNKQSVQVREALR